SGQSTCTLEACNPASRSTSPPLICRCGFGLLWRLMMSPPSTTSRFLSASTFNTRPRLPRSLPVITMTLSFLRIGVPSLDIAEPRNGPSQHFGGQRNNLHEPALAQLARDRTEHARADRLV